VLNPHVKVDPPAPGVVVYRFEESYLYPNSSLINSTIVDYVKQHTRRGKNMAAVKLSDRPWNDPGPGRGVHSDPADDPSKPLLHAIVLDFSGVSHIDTTGVQALIDTRNEIERWTDHPVEFHFATILSPWIRRALIAGGFGTGAPASNLPREIAAVVPFRGGYAGTARPAPPDPEAAIQEVPQPRRPRSMESSRSDDTVAPLVPEDTPFFHFDLAEAVRAAEIGLLQMSSRETQSDSSSKKTDL